MIRLFRLSTVLLILCLAALPAQAQDWVTFTDETATRLVASPALGVSDVQEKDYAIGDVDQDGDIDVVVVRKVPFTNSGPERNVLLMNENGVLTDRTAELATDMLDATDDRDVQLVDLDQDGWIDMITGTTLGDQPRILMNRGNDEFGEWRGFAWEAARLPVFDPPPQFCAVAVGDVTGDNVPDVYFADYDNTLENRLLINDGNGFFTDETEARTTTEMAESVFGTDAEIFDMNGDTFNDIVKNNSSGQVAPGGFSSNTSILYNDGTGNFTSIDRIYDDAPYMTDVADYNQDGRLDVFIVDDGQDRVLFNTGNNVSGHAEFTTTSVSPSPDTSLFGGNTWTADVDLDGILDIVVSDVDTDIPNCDDSELTILRGTGTPPNISYSDPILGASRSWRQRGTFDAVVFDINGDGAPDMLVGHCAGTRVLMGDPEIGDARIFVDGFEEGNADNWSAVVP